MNNLNFLNYLKKLNNNSTFEFLREFPMEKFALLTRGSNLGASKIQKFTFREEFREKY